MLKPDLQIAPCVLFSAEYPGTILSGMRPVCTNPRWVPSPSPLFHKC